MGRHLFFLVMMAMVFLANPLNAQERLSSPDAAKLVTEYCDREIIDERRAEIIAALRAAPESRVILPLRRQLEANKFGVQISQLIRELKHPRTWDILAGYLDGPYADLALDLLFRVGGEPILLNLRNRWKTCNTASLEFELLSDGFADYAADVTFFVQHVSDANRGVAARQIVTRALSLPADTPAEKLAATWQNYSRTFDRQGKSLLEGAKWDNTPVRKFGTNYFMPATQRVMFTDFDAYQRSDHTIFMKFRVVKNGGANGPRLGYQTEAGAWAFDVQDSKLTLRSSRGSESLALNVDDWNTLAFYVRQQPNRQGRLLWVSLNGVRYNSNNPLSFNGTIQALFARANDGELIVGSWDLIEN